MNEKKYLTMNDIMELIAELSHSQGFYGRLFLSICELEDCDPEGYNDLVNEWENRFTSPLDFILYLEC